MTETMQNNLFYVCALIEYIARQTKNKRGYVVEKIGEAGVKKLLKDASVNHSLSFEQVSDEVIAQYGINNGTFDTISDCKYNVPGFMDIGRLYSYIIKSILTDETIESLVVRVFASFLSDEISKFKTGLYYTNPSYLAESYKAGKLLD